MRRGGIPKNDIEKCTRGGGGQLKFAKGEGMLRRATKAQSCFRALLMANDSGLLKFGN